MTVESAAGSVETSSSWALAGPAIARPPAVRSAAAAAVARNRTREREGEVVEGTISRVCDARVNSFCVCARPRDDGRLSE